MHTAEIIFYSKGPTDSSYEESFATVAKSIEWIEFMIHGGHHAVRAWLDGEEVMLFNGKVHFDDGKRFTMELLKPYLGLQPGQRMEMATIPSKMAIASGLAKYAKSDRTLTNANTLKVMGII